MNTFNKGVLYLSSSDRTMNICADRGLDHWFKKMILSVFVNMRDRSCEPQIPTHMRYSEIRLQFDSNPSFLFTLRLNIMSLTSQNNISSL